MTTLTFPMAVPVITQPSTPRTVALGIAIPSLTLSATGSPTSWAVDTLPEGLSLATATGVITGTPTAEGLVTSEITATNGDGTSTAVSILWDVRAQPPGGGNWNDLELDFDLQTRLVTIPGVTTAEDGAVFRIAKGDRINLLIGFTKWGVLQDLKPGSETVSVKLGMKEFEPDRQIELAGGTPTKVGSADTTRFRIELYLDPADWSVLADYEGDLKTSFYPVTEIEVEVDTYRVTSLPFKVEAIRDQVED